MYAVVCVFIGDVDVSQDELKAGTDIVQERLAPFGSYVITHPYVIKFIGDYLIREEHRATGDSTDHALSGGTDRRHPDPDSENVEGGSGT